MESLFSLRYINRHAIRPTAFLSILHDHTDKGCQVTKALLMKVPIFTNLAETQRSTISSRFVKLFTLSGIHHATEALLVA